MAWAWATRVPPGRGTRDRHRKGARLLFSCNHSSEASGVFAQCEVGGGFFGPEYCALICGPNGAQGGTCPTGMSCESVQDTGICMWPDSDSDSEVAADVSE